MPKFRYLRGPHGGLVQGTVFALSFPDKGVDAVICPEVIDHIPDLPPLFQKMTRVLRPGGTPILGMPDSGCRLWWTLEWIYGKIRPGAYAHEHIPHCPRDSLGPRLESCGYTAQDLKDVGFCEMIF